MGSAHSIGLRKGSSRAPARRGPAVKWIEPEWPAPASVRAISTLRSGGFSQGPYDSLNLGLHVGDEADQVQRNREQLETVPRSGIVHRIDKDTSGLLMVAKTLEAHKHLVDQLQD
ncbi:MAG: hypothetical protein EBY15_13335, partial [Gammaproteobacteria bacterium]|nr:hypothetical protein [Gammaproteobacteria bacterium]